MIELKFFSTAYIPGVQKNKGKLAKAKLAFVWHI